MRWLLVLAIGTLGMVNATASGGALGASSARTGAVIDVSGTEMGALLEAKLLADGKLAWVERAQINKVIAEQELQALFSPEGGSNRARLGKFLKADVLVVLRLQGKLEADGKYLDIVVCETERGL